MLKDSLDKKEVRSIVDTFKKVIAGEVICENDMNELSLFQKYLKENDLSCIVTDTKKVILAFGDDVIKYKGKNISKYIKKCIHDEYTMIVDGDSLKIVANQVFPGRIHYLPIKMYGNNMGSIIFVNNNDVYSQKQRNFILKF